jgi:hypothetical protein
MRPGGDGVWGGVAFVGKFGGRQLEIKIADCVPFGKPLKDVISSVTF